jgi:hypothetical protein
MPKTVFSFSLGIQPGRANGVRALGELAGQGEWRELLVSVAYATETGARQLIGEFEATWPKWTAARKLFLVGLDYGRTEPRALLYLNALPNTECRIFAAEATLLRKLWPVSSYHPKVYAFGDALSFSKAAYAGVIAGSLNLTGGGLTTNFEAYARCLFSRNVPQGAEWLLELAYLEDMVLAGTQVTPALIDKYSKLRPGFALKPEDFEPLPSQYIPTSDLDASHVRALRTARYLWTDTLRIVANRGPGHPGNQVDLKKGVRAFFGSTVPLSAGVNTTLGMIPTVVSGPPESCAMRFGHNGMDKVNLPIPGGSNPPQYDHRCLLWERLPKGAFRLQVHPNGASWKKASAGENTRFNYTGNQREWGFFSAAVPV